MSCGMWDLPGPGIRLVSAALQNRFMTTGPPGKKKKNKKQKNPSFLRTRTFTLSLNLEMSRTGSSLVVQWLILSTFTAECPGFNPRFGGTKNLQAVWCSKKNTLKKKKRKENG